MTYTNAKSLFCLLKFWGNCLLCFLGVVAAAAAAAAAGGGGVCMHASVEGVV